MKYAHKKTEGEDVLSSIVENTITQDLKEENLKSNCDKLRFFNYFLLESTYCADT